MAHSLSPSSCSSNSPYLSAHRSHDYIEEGNESQEKCSKASNRIRNHPSPLYPPPSITTVGSFVAGKGSGKNRSPEKVAVNCKYNCRPASLDKTMTSSVVPMADVVSKHPSPLSLPSPTAIVRSIRSSVARRSPKPSPETSSSSAAADKWKIAVAEVSRALVHVSRERDEAVQEASNLKYSIADLEKKLNNLEIYCRNLKSGLEIYKTTRNEGIINHQRFPQFNHLRIDGHDQIIENFLVAVSEARSAIRILSKTLTIQFLQIGAKSLDQISSLLQPFDIKISCPRTLISYLEALLNLALFEDFESAGFMKNSTNRILKPMDRCEAQYAAFRALRGLKWEEVLSKGTKHFSEDFSKFCDRKMSEIAAMLGWNRAWSEPLLQAFFGASKSVWLVHLLANSVNPSLPIFRVEKGSGYDFVYMEDMGGDRMTQRLVPTSVRIMVTPGFYVYDNVVKCKALCRYHGISSTSIVEGGSYVKGLGP